MGDSNGEGIHFAVCHPLCQSRGVVRKTDNSPTNARAHLIHALTLSSNIKFLQKNHFNRNKHDNSQELGLK